MLYTVVICILVLNIMEKIISKTNIKALINDKLINKISIGSNIAKNGFTPLKI